MTEMCKDLCTKALCQSGHLTPIASSPRQAVGPITVLLHNELRSHQLTTVTEQTQEFTHGGPLSWSCISRDTA